MIKTLPGNVGKASSGGYIDEQANKKLAENKLIAA